MDVISDWYETVCYSLANHNLVVFVHGRNIGKEIMLKIQVETVQLSY